jgi:uncharacterized protein (TIRG00374 family)
MLKKILIPAALLIISIVAAFYLVENFDARVLKQITFYNGLIIFAIITLYSVSGLVYFAFIFNCFGHRLPLWKLYAVLSGSYSFNFAGPVKIGIPVRIYLLNELLRVPVAISIAAITVRQFADIVSLLLLSAVLAKAFLGGAYSNYLLLGLVIVVGAFVLLVRNPGLSSRIIRIPRLRSAVSKIQAAIGNLRPRQVAVIFLISMGRFFILGLGTFYISRILGSDAHFFALWGAEVTAVAVGVLSLMPMGIGTKDVSLGYFLIKAGVSKNISAGIVIVERTLNLVFTIIVGIVCANVIGLKYVTGGMKNENYKG